MAWQTKGTETKENVFNPYPLRARWLLLSLMYIVAIYLLAFIQDNSLPTPKIRANSKSDEFIAENALEHLINLTSIGPRVAGSYENEVLAKLAITLSLHSIKAKAGPDVRFDIDVFSSSGKFSLTFFDGMNSIYNNVTNIVARIAPAIESKPPKAAILLNCHTDTVPDSPGASDDGAGCAVALEAVRALLAGPPLRRPVLLLLNAAEENIMQGSHAFVTGHPWARAARTFINLEACGSGGREVLFQAGPNDPWLLDLYSRVVPAPLATSVAQELFDSGLIPADTDFRIFRDFANISGLDFAWSSNGWVYHTALDTADRVPAGALQRSGDNVLSLLKGLQMSPKLDFDSTKSKLPVFFDLFGKFVVVVAPRSAAALALGAAALALLRAELDARAAALLYLNRQTWWSLIRTTVLATFLGITSGVTTSVLTGYLLYYLDAQMPYYSQIWLILPLFVIPSFAVFIAVVKVTCRNAVVLARGFWSERLGLDAIAVSTAAVLTAGTFLGLRSSLIPALWCLPHIAFIPVTVYELYVNKPVSAKVRYALWGVLCTVPMFQSASLSIGWVHMCLPILGRAGTSKVPVDVLLGLTVTLLLLHALACLLPLLLPASIPRALYWTAAAIWLFGITVSLVSGFPYSPERPARYMVFHTRRTFHRPQGDVTKSWYWLPHLDPATPKHIKSLIPELNALRKSTAYECRKWLYCGAPYYLPVLGLVGAGHWSPAAAAPAARLRASWSSARINATAQELTGRLEGPSHIVVIIASPEHGIVKDCGFRPVELGAPFGNRKTAFFLIHDGSGKTKVTLKCIVRNSFDDEQPFVDISAAAHAMTGENKLSKAHEQLLNKFPPWAAVTGWGVDMHYYRVLGQKKSDEEDESFEEIIDESIYKHGPPRPGFS